MDYCEGVLKKNRPPEPFVRCMNGYLNLLAENFLPIFSFILGIKLYKRPIPWPVRPHYGLSKSRAPLWDIMRGLARCG